MGNITVYAEQEGGEILLYDATTTLRIKVVNHRISCPSEVADSLLRLGYASRKPNPAWKTEEVRKGVTKE